MENANSKVAVVTGAGSGIGRATAIELYKSGWQVVLAGRRIDALTETAAFGKFDEKDFLAIATDVSIPSSVSDLFAETCDKFGRVDLLFNNAGINIPAVEIDEINIDDWKRVVDTNLTGVFLCTQAAFKTMKSQTPVGGKIINNGSISAHVPRPNSIAYTSTKHAVTGLTKSTSLDGRKYNIVCGQIDIGNATSEMTAKMQSGVPQADGTRAVEPTMNVQNVADAVVHMANMSLDANVQFMTVIASKMPYIGRG